MPYSRMKSHPEESHEFIYLKINSLDVDKTSSKI